MNIALVFPPFYFEPMYNMPPLGLINLATVLRDTPHAVKIFDFPLAIRRKTLPLGKSIYQECALQILQFQPGLAGFSVQCTTYPPALKIAEELKRLAPGIKVVFGGHNASFIDELTLARFPFIDAVVRGEGEITFPELIEGVEGIIDLGKVEGITFRLGDRIIRNPDRKLIEDLDSLPVSDYTTVPSFEVYRDVCGIRRSIAILEIGRGCPHRCIYCSQSLLWRRKTRTFSIARLIQDMKTLQNDFGAECFLLAYDQFTARRSFAEEFCHQVIDAGLNRIPWYCISRLDTVDESLLKLMREAGCESMCYGIDSGSKRTLAFIRKNIDHEVLFKRVRETTDSGIVPTLSFVTGFPEETREDLDSTLQLALKSAITGNANILVQMATTLPGTDLHKNYAEKLVREVDTYFSLGIEFDNGKRLRSDDELIDSAPLIFSSFYNLPCPACSLKDLNAVASYFSIIASLYPRTTLLLGLDTGLPISDIFFRFLDRVAEINGTGERTLTPHDCIGHFEDFASSLPAEAEREHPRRAYLPEIIRYETCLIQTGKLELSPLSFHIDLNRSSDLKPLRNQKILLEEFTFDIPNLIIDLKRGHFPRTCAQKSVYLLFRQVQAEIDVREVNRFGFDFLLLCDGQRSIASIADQLYPEYGEEMERDKFASLCAEAARTLADLTALIPGQSA
ncbi:MAG: radical SAM protein [Syntrophobacteraceae bacterium]